MRRCSWLVLGCLWTLAQATAAPLFETEEPLALVLTGPLAQTLGDRSTDPAYLPYTLREGDSTAEVSVRPRGASRRSICRFPPLRLKFPRSGTPASFTGQDKLKLVTHCNRRASAEQNVLEEYLAYRLLNAVTDASFRVRPLHVTYVDAAHPQRSTLTRWAFVIEDVQALAARLGGSHLEPRRAAPAPLDADHAALISLFQYLIGNTDFALDKRRENQRCCHNAKLVARTDGLISVPYDFDQSGLVDAAYAGANPVHNARDVRTRVYVGACVPTDTLQDALDTLRQHRARLTRTVDAIPGMTASTRRRAHSYIDRFYDRTRPDNVARLLRGCR